MSVAKRPWNKNRLVGQKRPFSKTQISAIVNKLRKNEDIRQLCLFMLGIDTMLRGSDLVRLKVSDLADSHGQIRNELRLSQQKTAGGVVIALTPLVRSATQVHISKSGLNRDDFLFTAERSNHHITTNYLRRLVKQWARLIGLDPEDYSSHSLRRSKPSYLYSRGVRPEMLRLLLGHKSLQSTQSYLGIDQNDALELARFHDLFEGM